jgi:hypothetical protein
VVHFFPSPKSIRVCQEGRNGTGINYEAQATEGTEATEGQCSAWRRAAVRTG